MEIKFHGQSCFELSEGETRVLIDPFLKPNNPVAVTTGEEVDPTHIFLSHGHADHIADAVPVAKRTGAKCVAIVELAKWLEGQGIGDVADPNFGGTTVYHAGDTCLFSDMKLVAQRSPVDVALLPIGGHYTMDRHDAVLAAELIGAGTVIPMHYDTFPAIETDAQTFKSDVEAKTSSSVVVLEPGQSHTTG
jgi:L-ascorbate metabolism protein UlaG (beta-lactamase superfamily)